MVYRPEYVQALRLFCCRSEIGKRLTTFVVCVSREYDCDDGSAWVEYGTGSSRSHWYVCSLDLLSLQVSQHPGCYLAFLNAANYGVVDVTFGIGDPAWVYGGYTIGKFAVRVRCHLYEFQVLTRC